MNELQAVNGADLIPIVNGNGGELIDRYIMQLSQKPKTVDTYRKALKQFLNFIEGIGKAEAEIMQSTVNATATAINGITEIGKAEIVAYKNFLEACKLKPSTVGTYLTAVKGLFRWLEAEKIYPDIARDVKGVKYNHSFSKEALSTQQARRILDIMERQTLEGKRDFALVNLLMRTGLRTIEAERATLEDISIKDGQTVLYIQGKGRDYKDEFIILTAATLEPIQEYLQARGETDGKAALFAAHGNRSKGQPLTTRSISRIIKNAMRAAGIDSEKLTAHSLRHTACTFAFKAGATVPEVQKLARHSNINTTMIYIHQINRIENAPERKIDSYLDTAF